MIPTTITTEPTPSFGDASEVTYYNLGLVSQSGSIPHPSNYGLNFAQSADFNFLLKLLLLLLV